MLQYQDTNGEIVPAVVVEMDFDIGVSIVSADDPDDFFVCLHGRLSPIYPGLSKYSHPSEQYQKMYEYIKSCLPDGVIQAEKLAKIGSITAGVSFITKSDCAFNY